MSADPSASFAGAAVASARDGAGFKELDEGTGPRELPAGGRGGGIAPRPAADLSATSPPPALIPKVGREVVLCGSRMSPRGASTIAMLRSEGGLALCVEVVGEGGASAKDGAGTAREGTASELEAGGAERCAESGRGNCGGVSSYSYSSSSLSLDDEKPLGMSPELTGLAGAEEEGLEVDHPGMEGSEERSCCQLNAYIIAGRTQDMVASGQERERW